jgi:hypothetical protein
MVNENLEKRKLMENKTPDLAGLISCLQKQIPEIKNFQGCLSLDQTKCVGEIVTYVITHPNIIGDVQSCATNNGIELPKLPTGTFPGMS